MQLLCSEFRKYWHIFITWGRQSDFPAFVPEENYCKEEISLVHNYKMGLSSSQVCIIGNSLTFQKVWLFQASRIRFTVKPRSSLRPSPLLFCLASHQTLQAPFRNDLPSAAGIGLLSFHSEEGLYSKPRERRYFCSGIPGLSNGSYACRRYPGAQGYSLSNRGFHKLALCLHDYVTHRKRKIANILQRSTV